VTAPIVGDLGESSNRALPSLGEDEVHVWIVDIAANGNVPDTGVLAPAERARASQFRWDFHRDSFMRRRIALRMILGGYLGVSPHDVAFIVNEFGKPSVVPRQGRRGLSFNTSHSETIAAIAVARSGRIGIDVEHVKPLAEADSVAERFFADGERAALATLAPRDRVDGFFNAWTRKEAVVKALGGGLSIPLNSFEVSLLPGVPPTILRWDIPGEVGARWRIHHIEPALSYIGALVLDRKASVCQCRSWPG